MVKSRRYRTHNIIRSFEAKALRKRPLSIKIADKLTSYFGSLFFLLLNIFLFTFWILINAGKIPGIPVFDPYPYVLLITFVSLEAIILTTVVLMSQNRQSQIATLRDELQLQVELITEKEISKVLNLLKKVLEKHNIKVTDHELEEMLEAVDTSYIERKLEEQLNHKLKK
ncbi:MAG: DUF1003 domain-containing protein [Candidatus Woesebacteria bacterium]|jgi:uncharacterized membrane protein